MTEDERDLLLAVAEAVLQISPSPCGEDQYSLIGRLKRRIESQMYAAEMAKRKGEIARRQGQIPGFAIQEQFSRQQ